MTVSFIIHLLQELDKWRQLYVFHGSPLSHILDLQQTSWNSFDMIKSSVIHVEHFL